LKPVKSYRQKPGRKEGWGSCSSWHKPGRSPPRVKWVQRRSNASAGFSFTAGRLYGRLEPVAITSKRPRAGPRGAGLGHGLISAVLAQRPRQGGGSAKLRWRMAAPVLTESGWVMAPGYEHNMQKVESPTAKAVVSSSCSERLESPPGKGKPAVFPAVFFFRDDYEEGCGYSVGGIENDKPSCYWKMDVIEGSTTIRVYFDAWDNGHIEDMYVHWSKHSAIWPDDSGTWDDFLVVDASHWKLIETDGNGNTYTGHAITISAAYDWTFKFHAEDKNGNVWEDSHTINGVLGGIVEWLADAADWLVDDFLNPLGDWFNDKLNSFFTYILDPVYNGIAPFISSIESIMEPHAQCIEGGGTPTDEDIEIAANSINLEFINTDVFSLVSSFTQNIALIQWVLIALSFILPGATVVATSIGDIVAGAAFDVFLAGATFYLSEALGYLIGVLLPDFGEEGSIVEATITLSLSVGVVLFAQYQTQSPIGSNDAFGLGLSLIGYVISTFGSLSGNEYQQMLTTTIGLMLEIIGFTISMTNLFGPSLIEDANALIGSLDEMVSAGLLGLSANEVKAYL